MPRRNCFLTAQFAPRWQRVAFLLATLLVSLCFTSIGLTTGRFQLGFFDANRSVQRVFGQLVLFLPMTGMMTAVLLRLLQNTSVLIRIDARVMIARRIFGGIDFFDRCRHFFSLGNLVHCRPVMVKGWTKWHRRRG